MFDSIKSAIIPAISLIATVSSFVLTIIQIKLGLREIKKDNREDTARKPIVSKGRKKKLLITFLVFVALLMITIALIWYWVTPHKGTIKRQDGSIYTGQIARGLPEGEGELIEKDYTIIDGLWTAGVLVSGTAKYDTGDLFEFEVESENPNVRNGTYRFKNLPRSGHEQDSYFIGRIDTSDVATNYNTKIISRMTGTFHYTDGTEINGEYLWYDGVIIPDGLYTGMMTVEDSHNISEIVGFGTIQYENGNSYTGELKNGLPDGAGAMTYSGGSIFEGEFVEGRRDGMGLYHSEDGMKAFQQYEKDSLIPCEVELTVVLQYEDNTKVMYNQKAYHINGGETIDISARDSFSDIGFIGYYFFKENEEDVAFTSKETIRSDHFTITIPDKQSNSDTIYLAIEAVADNDDGSSNYITKTGWQHYKLVYDKEETP